MWLVIWKDRNGEIGTNAFDGKSDAETFADDIEGIEECKILYVFYDARA